MKLELSISVTVDLDKVNAELGIPTQSVNYLVKETKKRLHRLLDADPATTSVSVDFPEEH